MPTAGYCLLSLQILPLLSASVTLIVLLMLQALIHTVPSSTPQSIQCSTITVLGTVAG